MYWLIGGSGVVGWIVCTPAPARLKQIVSVPGLVFAKLMAALSEPDPVVGVSPVLVTVELDVQAALALISGFPVPDLR